MCDQVTLKKTDPSCVNILHMLIVLKWRSPFTCIDIVSLTREPLFLFSTGLGTKLMKAWITLPSSLGYHEFNDVLVGSVAVLIVDTGKTILGKELLVICIGCVPLEMLTDVGCMVVATWFSLFISSCHPGTFLPVICLLACLVRWSDLINLRPQRGQAKRFSPVWVRLCLASSSDLAKRLSQFSQVQGNGFSPVCVLIWAFKWELLK